jgi:hypothetical protein
MHVCDELFTSCIFYRSGYRATYCFMQGKAGRSLVAVCNGCPLLASIAGALLRKYERRKLSRRARNQSDCEDMVTENLKAEGCGTWKELEEQFTSTSQLGEEMSDPGFAHGNYSNVANAYSMLVAPLLKRSQGKNRGDEMAAMLEYASATSEVCVACDMFDTGLHWQPYVLLPFAAACACL